MVQRLVCCLSVLCLSVSVVIATDQPGKSSPLPSPIADHSSRPVEPARIPEVEEKLTPVEHLRRAAEHLDAAAVGKNADTLHQQADELRDAVNQLESQLAARLEKLHQQAAEIQQEIQELDGAQPVPDQLEIEFRVVELDLARLEQLGFQMDFIRSNGEVRVVQAGATSEISGMLNTIPSEAMKGFLDGLVSEGHARVFSEISMKVSSGRPATCLRGGEFPFLVPQAGNTRSIDWRTYGTRIEVLAEVLENGKLRLDVSPEYSWRDFTNAVKVDGMVIPGITTTRLNTQVEMEFGQTLLLSGQRSPASRELIKRTQAKQESNGIATEDEAPRKPLIFLATPRRVAEAKD